MSVDDFLSMLECANILQSQEQIVKLDAVSFGITDDKGRKNIFKRYHKIADAEKYEEKPLDLQQIQRFLSQNQKKVR